MTEKRFKLHIDWFNYDKTEGSATLRDNGQPLLECECVEDMRRVKELLNELNDENEQLKTQVQNTSAQRDEFHRGARENANRVGELEKENEHLKQKLKIYRKVANCSNCDFQDYDCGEDGDVFEICDKGKDMENGICEDWRVLE